MTERWLYAWGLGSVAFGGASLLIPLYLVQLGGTPVDLGVLFATSAAIGAPGAIVFGRLADRVGHRRTLVLATLAVVAGALAVVPLLTDVTAVIVANAGLWLVVASVSPVLTMLIVADAPSEAWTERIGQLNKFQGYGWAGGLVVGSLWPVVGRPLLGPDLATRGLFWILAACAAIAVLLAARTLPRPDEVAFADERTTRRIARVLATTGTGIKGATFIFSPNRLYWSTRSFHPRRLARRMEPTVTTYLVAAGLFFAGFAAFWAPLPLFFTETGFTPGQIFGLYLASSVAAAVLFETAGQIAARYDVRRLQSGALALRAVLFVVVALVAGLGAASLGFGVAGVVLAGIGLTWAVIAVVGTAIVTQLAPPAVRGEVLGVHTAIAAVAGGIGGILGGWAATLGYLVAFTIAGGLVLTGAGLVWTLRVLSGDPAAPTSGDPPGDVPTPAGPDDDLEPTPEA